MAFDFTPEDPALNFGPRPHARWSSRRFLLWPARAYRVVAPRVRQRQLNVLQRAIMGLCRTGAHRVDEIAAHLSVHRDLVGHIISELDDRGYLDKHGLPTEHGVRVLEEDSFESEEMVAGYVFQDPWSGELWPRFVESLEYCEREFNAKGFASVLLGTTGKPRRHHLFTVLPRAQLTPSTPNAAAIVQAVSLHRKGLRFREGNDHDDEPVGSYVASNVQIDRVSFIEEKPQPVFLLTYLYVPESGADATDWHASDPFGFGQSARLRRRVEAVMHDDPGLFGVVNRLVGETLHASYEEQHRWLEAIQLQAGLEIDRRLTVGFRTHSVFDQMLELEAARQEMRSLDCECPARRINEVLRAGSKVLEAVFAWIATLHPLGDIWKRVYVRRFDRREGRQRFVPQPNRKICAATYKGAFHSLGFTARIPGAFLKVKPEQVRSVSEFGDSWRLRPLVTATALLAQRDPTHPLARAASIAPHLLIDIETVAAAGGEAGHANANSVAPQLAEQHVDKVYDVVSVLLDLGAMQSSST